MTQEKQAHVAAWQQPEPHTEFTALDRWTKQAAVALSRRTFAKRLFGLTTAVVGVQLLDVKPAAAVSCYTCPPAPCGTCKSTSGTCCYAGYCYTGTCTCNAGCGKCGTFKASVTICSNGDLPPV